MVHSWCFCSDLVWEWNSSNSLCRWRPLHSVSSAPVLRFSAPVLRFSAPVGIRVQPVLQRIIGVTTFEQEEIIMSVLLTTILYKAFSSRPTWFLTPAPSPRNAHSHERWRCLDCHVLSLYHRACLTSPYCSYTRTCIHTGTAITPLTVPCHPHVARWDARVSLGGKR